MSRHVKYSPYQKQFKPNYPNHRLPQLPPRSSLNIAQFSLVHENDNQSRMLDTQQMSLLQKIAQDNKRVVNSGRIDEQDEYKYSKPPLNQMKFSFNNNFEGPQDAKFGNRPVEKYQQKKQYRIQYEQQQERGKFYSQKTPAYSDTISKKFQFQLNQKPKSKMAGSIKRNNTFQDQQSSFHIKEELQARKIVNHQANNNEQKIEQNRLDFMIDQRLNDLERKESSQKMKNQLGKNKINAKSQKKIEQLAYQSQNTYSPNKFKYQTTQQSKINEKPLLKHFTFQNFDIVHYLQILFDRLDGNKTGKISKYNCTIGIIRDQFKYIFGVLFSRIVLKEISYTKREFVKECIIAIKQFQCQQIYNFLRDLDPQWQQNQGRTKTKSISKQNQYSQMPISNKALSQNQQRKRALDNIFYRNQISPQIEKFNASLSKQQVMNEVNINRRPYTLQETRYNTMQMGINEEMLRYKNTPMRQLQDEQMQLRLGKQIKSRQHYNLLKEEMRLLQIQQNQKIQLLQQQSKKKRNISEQILNEHKNSLQNIMRLNQRMQSFIFRKIADQEQANAINLFKQQHMRISSANPFIQI